MSLVNRLSVRARLVLLVMVPLAMMLIFQVTAVMVFNKLQEEARTIYADRVVPMGQLKAVSDVYELQVPDAVNKVNTGLMTPRQALDEIRQARSRANEQWKAYMATYLTPEEAVLAKETEAILANVRPAIDDLEGKLAALGDVGTGQLVSSMGAMYAAVDAVGEKMAALYQLQQDVAKQEYDKAVVLKERITLWFIIIGVGVLAATTLYGYIVYRSVVQPLNDLICTMQEAERDANLTLTVKAQGDDEISQAGRAYNGMMTKFRSAVERIMGVTSQVASAAEEMSAVSEQTAQEIHRQQQETDRVATAMTEMAASVQEVAGGAARSATATREADEQGRNGKAVVLNATHSIRGVAEQLRQVNEMIAVVQSDSQNIGMVLDVIRAIADQTNLLALNAAIEAARAGEQGRGFAVVADEVRTLAQRTQDSTREIAEMISRLQANSSKATEAMLQGVEQVNSSAELATRAGEALEAIGRSLDAITDMSTQIASATEEQSAVAEEVNRNVVNIRDIGNSTASGAAEAAAASTNLARLASELQDTVSRFRV